MLGWIILLLLLIWIGGLLLHIAGFFIHIFLVLAVIAGIVWLIKRAGARQ